MTTNKPEALELARRTIRQLSNAERDRILEQYLSDGIAVDKARIAELEAALIGVREQPAPAVQGELVADGFREIVEAVAHIGVDFGYGKFDLSQEHIEKARALLEATPQPVEQQPEPISRNLRAVHVMILNALDRDAVDGKAARGEMAAELRLAISEQQPAEHKPCPDTLIGRTVSMNVSTGDHNAFHRLFGTVVGVEGQSGVILCELDEDNQDKQPAPDVAGLVEALERVKIADDEPMHHARHGSAYWNDAVTACICAVISAHRKGGES